MAPDPHQGIGTADPGYRLSARESRTSAWRFLRVYGHAEETNEVSMSTMELLPGPGPWDHVSQSDWAEVLASFPLFSRIGKRRLRRLVRRATFAEYSPGDIVIQKGEGAWQLAPHHPGRVRKHRKGPGLPGLSFLITICR